MSRAKKGLMMTMAEYLDGKPRQVKNTVLEQPSFLAGWRNAPVRV